MQNLIKLFSQLLLIARHYPKALAEAEAAKLYIHAIQDARLAVLGIIGLLTSVFALVAGFVLLVLGVAYKVSPDSIGTMAIVFGGILFALPLLGFIIGLSQQFLVKAAKIEDLVEKVKEDSRMAHLT